MNKLSPLHDDPEFDERFWKGIKIAFGTAALIAMLFFSLICIGYLSFVNNWQ